MHAFLLITVVAQLQGVEAARTYRQAHEAEILQHYSQLLAIPNVASDSVNIRKNADFLAGALGHFGVKTELWEIAGAPPAVYGELLVPGATRTLGIYVHYDGQPVDSTKWRTPPWQPTLFADTTPIPFPQPGEPVDPEWRIFARSAGDDKAPFGALLPALAALRDAGIEPTSNFKFLFDGEEEAGSPHLGAYMKQHAKQLADIDAWLFFDGPVHSSRKPQIVFGVRGITALEITVYGATRALHSGHYGNWSPNPAMLLAQLLASLKDESGQVLIEKFYDSTEPVGEEELAAIAALPDVDADLKQELGLATTEGAGVALPMRLLMPSLNIRGFTSGNTGELAQNVIPTTAAASIDIRLVKGNDPVKMLELVEAHIRKQGYHVVREDPDKAVRMKYAKVAKVVREVGYRAARSSMSEPVLMEVVAAARAAAPDLLLVPTMGGSLPLHLFAKPTIIVPIANHDNNQHAANENLRIGNLWYGIELFAGLLTMP